MAQAGAVHDPATVRPSDRAGRSPSVLFVYPFDATFIQADLQLLRTFCRVAPLLFDEWSRCGTFFRLLRSADIVFCWFALPFSAVASVAAKLSGRRAIIVSGGWDVTGMPEIGYGRLLKVRGTVFARIALLAADAVLSFSDSSAVAVRSVAPNCAVQRVYLGVDPSCFRPEEKEELVVSAANVTRENVVRKGLRTFVQAAREVPEAQFVLAGNHVDSAVEDLRAIAPANVSFPGWLPDDELRRLLGRAKVYVQASYTEGFGVAVAEAMASGCVPVVTRRGALPELVGDAGLYVEYGDGASLANAVRVGLRSDLGPRARTRIMERFTLGHRLQALRDVVYGFCQEGDQTSEGASFDSPSAGMGHGP